jgi:DNA-binding transcriptional LysR family regulator
MRLGSHVPELSALDVLLTVAQAGSLNAAATQLGVSQQAVSARVTAIEAQTGVRLFTRSRTGSSLTPEGTVVAQWASRVLDAAHELDVGLGALRAEHRGRLRVSASLTVAEHLLPGWLVSFHAAARARGEHLAEVTLTAANSGVVTDHVRAGSADLGFIESPNVPSGLRSRVVARDELLLVVRRDHPFGRRRRPVEPALLAQTPLVSREIGSGTREALTAAGRTCPRAVHNLRDPQRRACRRRARGAQQACRPGRPGDRTANVRPDDRARPAPRTARDLARRPDAPARRGARPHRPHRRSALKRHPSSARPPGARYDAYRTWTIRTSCRAVSIIPDR